MERGPGYGAGERRLVSWSQTLWMINSFVLIQIPNAHSDQKDIVAIFLDVHSILVVAVLSSNNFEDDEACTCARYLGKRPHEEMPI